MNASDKQFVREMVQRAKENRHHHPVLTRRLLRIIGDLEEEIALLSETNKKESRLE